TGIPGLAILACWRVCGGGRGRSPPAGWRRARPVRSDRERAMWPDARETQDLLDRARADAAAVEELWERHRPALRRMIGLRLDRALSRRVDASDIVQDVLVKANQRLREYLRQPSMPFHLWLRQIARDQVIDAHRRHRESARRSIDRE